jgi:hypothetical protein
MLQGKKIVELSVKNRKMPPTGIDCNSKVQEEKSGAGNGSEISSDQKGNTTTSSRSGDSSPDPA